MGTQQEGNIKKKRLMTIIIVRKIHFEYFWETNLYVKITRTCVNLCFETMSHLRIETNVFQSFGNHIFCRF